MKQLNHFNLICLFAAVSIFSCEDRNDRLINFAKVELLFNDTSLNNICINKIHSNKNNKYIFINRGEVYTIKKGLLTTDIIGSDITGVSKKRVLEDFKYYSKMLNSKGVVGSCLSIDSTLMFKTNDFDTNELQHVDTNGIYKNYQYICITTEDIRMFFVPHEYYSDLFFRKPFYFYYSNQ